MTGVLKAVGLDEAQEAVYRALLRVGAANARDVADRVELPYPDTLAALGHLARHGLAAQSPGAADRWVAAPPAVALSALVRQRRRELDNAQAIAEDLAEAFSARITEPIAQDVVEMVTGAQAVAQRFLQLHLGASTEICALVSAHPTVVSSTENHAEEPAARRGVHYRVVIEREVMEVPGSAAELSLALQRGEDVRVIDHVPTRLVVADRRVCLAPLLPDAAGPAALVIHASGLLHALMALFERVWNDALPLRLLPDGGAEADPNKRPDETDRQILSLLLVGMTDEAAARQLGLGLRTVQRRLQSLMVLTGASNRMQLGWRACERGWLTPPPE